MTLFYAKRKWKSFEYLNCFCLYNAVIVVQNNIDLHIVFCVEYFNLFYFICVFISNFNCYEAEGFTLFKYLYIFFFS